MSILRNMYSINHAIMLYLDFIFIFHIHTYIHNYYTYSSYLFLVTLDGTYNTNVFGVDVCM